MATQFVTTTIVVNDYDEAIDFYIKKLNFTLLEDNLLADNKRWVVISPYKDSGGKILLAKAINDDQLRSVGNQTGGRVAFFLNSDNFEADYQRFLNNGVNFIRSPIAQSYGMVAVFEDLYGNLWDLIG